MKKTYVLCVMLCCALLLIISVSAADQLDYVKTDKAVYCVGEPIMVTASAENVGGKDWIGIAPKGMTEYGTIYWEYLEVVGDGIAFDMVQDVSGVGTKDELTPYYDLPAGEYTIWLIPDNQNLKTGFKEAIASCDIRIIEDPNAPETTRAPETTKVPDTTNAPETTAEPPEVDPAPERNPFPFYRCSSCRGGRCRRRDHRCTEEKEALIARVI